MKKKLISQILSGAISVEELDDSSIGGEPNATVDDSKIPAAGTDSTATGTETTPAEVPATDPKPEDDVDGDATQAAPEDGAPATTGTEEPPAAEEPPTDAEPPATDAAGATEPGADASTEEPPADTAGTADGDAAGTTEPPADDPATAGDATAAATDGGTEDAGAPPATEEPPADDPSVASLGDEAGASGPAAGETGEPELDENGEPVKKEPSPDAEVTPLPEGVDPESAEEESNIDEDTLEDEEEIEESEEDIIAKADAVADLTNAQTSLEELAAEIESTIQDGGLTPEGVIAAQGAANDILNEVKEEPIGLPSQESFGTFEGRRANTIIALEGIGDKIKAVGSKIMEVLRGLLQRLRQLFDTQRRTLVSVEKAAAAASTEKYEGFTGGSYKVVGDAAKSLLLPNGTGVKLDARTATNQNNFIQKGVGALAELTTLIEKATAGGKVDVGMLLSNEAINKDFQGGLEWLFNDGPVKDFGKYISHPHTAAADVVIEANNPNDMRAMFTVIKNLAGFIVRSIDTLDVRVKAMEQNVHRLSDQAVDTEERKALSSTTSILAGLTWVIRNGAGYSVTLFRCLQKIVKAGDGASAA